MAKGQKRSNREIRKPKKASEKKNSGAGVSSVAATFAQPAGVNAKPRKK